jgi:hypothetical protein
VLDVRNVILQTNKDMHIFVVIAFVSTEMLLAVGALGNDMNDQIICRPLVMFIGTGNEDRHGRTAFIHQEMDFTAQFASVGRILASFRTA